MKKPNLSMLLLLSLMTTLITSCGKNKQEESTNTELNLKNMDLSFDFDIDFSKTYKRKNTNTKEIFNMLTEELYHGDFSKRDEDSKQAMPYYGYDITINNTNITTTPFESETSLDSDIKKWKLINTCNSQDCVTNALQTISITDNVETCTLIKIERHNDNTLIYHQDKACQ